MCQLVATLYAFVDKYMYWLHIPRLGVIDVVEIIIIALLLYYVIMWVRSTRAWTLFKGILVLLLFLLIAAVFQMNTILWLFGKLLNFAVIALVVIFQPELRRALERLGRRNPLTMLSNLDIGKNEDSLFSVRSINELVRGCFEMGKDKTGALIVIERSVKLNEYVRTGINLDAAISSQLILNIFEKNTPLHDGAVIMRGDRLVAATCYLPLSDSMFLSKDLGTRHRAALGISEVSDSVTLIVSEETGAVSVAMDGRLYLNKDEAFVREELKKAAGLTESASRRHKKRRRRTSREKSS